MTTVLQRRRFGASSVELSSVAYGSMRAPDGDLRALLRSCWEQGITTHHSSSEYDTYTAYCEAVRALRGDGCEFEHIIKLAAPGFDERRFDPTAVRQQLHDELRALGTSRIDVVQWMVRGADASDPSAKRDLLAEQAHLIDDTFRDLVQAGDVGAVALFPYIVPVLPQLLELDSVSGLCGYLNLFELGLASETSMSHPMIALRPLAAGLLGETAADSVPPPLEPFRARRAELLAALEVEAVDLPAFALRFPLAAPTVCTEVVSIRSADRLFSVIAAVEADAPVIDFAQTTAVLDPVN